MGHGDTMDVKWECGMGQSPPKKTALPAFGDYMTCWRQSRLHPTIKHSE